MADPVGAIAIGALSARTGCNIGTIRYYERIGLLPAPPRSAGGHRLYGADLVHRLTFIRHARTLGFTLDEVRALLRLADDRNRSCADVRAVASIHLADVRAKIADLKAMERVLRATIVRCAADSNPECAIIDALSAGGPVGAAWAASSNS
ncbi:MAG TPA: helix-turn-helix domain-containing protein [Geminicoccaceae bacterium]|jgi:MerR family mercuric resistance operon transcriptional regulator|nr:helix-turn-helix domain-containing protein [Geminicoccaceae bacterium]